MKSNIFFKWFLEWEVKTHSFTSEGELENRIIIYDDHLSHVGFPTLKHVRENKVIILKLVPSHNGSAAATQRICIQDT